MEQPGKQGTRGMWARYALFVILSFAILLINIYVMSILNPRKPQEQARRPAAAPNVQPEQQKDGAQQGEGAARPPQGPSAETQPAELPAEKQQPQPEKPPAVVEQPEVPPEWVTLGSADPAGPFRMLVTLSNQGASAERIELSSPRYRDLEDRKGYLGHVVGGVTAPPGGGCPVQVVGDGTPAALAGLKKGDLITAVDGRKVTGFLSLARVMEETEPGQTVRLAVLREGQAIDLPVTLRRRPLEVVRPEGTDPLSFLLTLARIDELTLENVVQEFQQEEGKGNEAEKKKEGQGAGVNSGIKQPDPAIGLEIGGLNLRTGTWEIARHDQTEAVFRRLLPAWNLEILKTYRLVEVPPESIQDETFRGYHLTLEVEIRNTGQQARKVAYQLDGPTGLPIEGYWYANKIGRKMFSAAGLRDVVVQFEGAREPKLIPCPQIAKDDVDPPWRDEPLTFIGVDAQYFSAVMIPKKRNPEEIWFATSQPLRVGPVDPKWMKIADTSCRLTSLARDLGPGESLTHSFLVFAGPKKPDLLAAYGLKELVYYGWFGWVAKPMLWLLHGFYAVVCNYGLAIIMLTVLVRSAMFPVSKKQALNAQKMAELQPEIKKIHEKYKKDFEARNKAQQELFRKHNYNPLSGCLVLFLQLPIFLGLYRGLMVDVELRQAPLISESIRWCSNLAAPDMLFDWSGFMPEFVTQGQGLLGLGPYFNLLPVLTIVLFIAQQKMFMPPPADEQAAMQQNVMKFMMVFMGVLFFKVASGLCLYFIASSAWGLAERKLLPRRATAAADEKPPQSGSSPAAAGKRDAAAAQKRRAEGDGAAGGKKKKQSRGRR